MTTVVAPPSRMTVVTTSPVLVLIQAIRESVDLTRAEVDVAFDEAPEGIIGAAVSPFFD